MGTPNEFRFSDQFVDLIERKLAASGIRKVIPAAARLAEAYRLFARGEKIRTVIEEAIANMDGNDISVPANLKAKVRAMLIDRPELSWDAALRELAEKPRK